jgi:hypothetical protein
MTCTSGEILLNTENQFKRSVNLHMTNDTQTPLWLTFEFQCIHSRTLLEHNSYANLPDSFCLMPHQNKTVSFTIGIETEASNVGRIEHVDRITVFFKIDFLEDSPFRLLNLNPVITGRLIIPLLIVNAARPFQISIGFDNTTIEI